MRVAIGSDHAGFDLKEAVKAFLAAENCEVLDVGTSNKAPVDYSDFAEAVGAAAPRDTPPNVASSCAAAAWAPRWPPTGFPGIRAGLCHDTYSAHQGVEHDDMNVLVLGGRVVGVELARELIHGFLQRPLQRRATPSAPAGQDDGAGESAARARNCSASRCGSTTSAAA